MSENLVPPVVLVHQGPDGEAHIVVSGRLDISCAGRLRNAVVSAAYEAKGRIAVDVSRVTAVDPIGLRTLVACRRLAAAVGIELVLLHPSPVLASRLARCGLHRTMILASAE